MTYHSTLHNARGGFDLEAGETWPPISEPTDNPVKYWWLERKSKRSDAWILETAFWATKERAESHLASYVARGDYEYRIRDIQIGKAP